MRGHRSAALLATAALLVGCAAGPPASEQTTHAAPSPQPNPPSSIGEASEEEVGTDWMTVPDTSVPTEAELSDEERLSMLRLPATHPAAEESCDATDLTGQLRYTDAATGSRFGVVLLRNDGEATCTLQGHPGVGARGEHGHPFHMEVEQLMQEEAAGPVPLGPGEIASANVRWGGALAGAESEWIATLYLQLFQDQVPMPIDIGERTLIDDPNPPPPDIGAFTTVRIEPVEPVDQAWLREVRQMR